MKLRILDRRRFLTGLVLSLGAALLLGLVVGRTMLVDDEDDPGPAAELLIRTEPAVPALLEVDGEVVGTFGTDHPVTPGEHTIRFGDVEGFTTPPEETVRVDAGDEVTVEGDYGERGRLEVTIEPDLDPTVLVGIDGAEPEPRQQGGLAVDVPPGDHRVCFGPLADFRPPPCEQTRVEAGATTEIVGRYEEEPGAPGPDGASGRLRVETDPPAPTMIIVDGVERARWSLEWLVLPVGEHEVCFSDVGEIPGPPCQQIKLREDDTTRIVASIDGDAET